MAKIFKNAYFDEKVSVLEEASLNVASSAVLYGLSVYTVFPIYKIKNQFYVFRIKDHVKRLQNSAKLIGISIPKECLDEKVFLKLVRELIEKNKLSENVFARATIHVNELVPGTRSKELSTCLSVFLYEMKSILPETNARLKVSPWRRNPDFCIPSRAKVNGAYVNSVLAKQDAIDSGYDDAIFLDINGHVTELSAANIFLVRDNTLITPGNSSDILEGINRKSILEIARSYKMEIVERDVDMTELYIADEIFAVGTSAFVSSVTCVDGRIIGDGKIGHVTSKFKKYYKDLMEGTTKSKYLLKI